MPQAANAGDLLTRLEQEEKQQSGMREAEGRNANFDASISRVRIQPTSFFLFAAFYSSCRIEPPTQP
jgi:hypothetical protein